MSVPSLLTKLKVSAVATVALLAAIAAAPAVAQSDEEGANDALELFWGAILESDFDAAAESLHPEHAARVVEALRGQGQDGLDLLGLASMADDIVLAEASDGEVLTWFVEVQFGAFPLFAEDIDEPIEPLGWFRAGDDGRAVIRLQVPEGDAALTVRLVQPTRIYGGEWRVLLPAESARAAGLPGLDTQAHDGGLTDQTALVQEFATAIGEGIWDAAAALIYAEDVQRSGELARALIALDGGEFLLDLGFGLEPSEAKDMTDWELTAAWLEANHATDFRFLAGAKGLLCEGIVGDDDSDVMVYGLTMPWGHESQTLSLRNDDGSPWILIPSLANWEAMATDFDDAP